MLGPTAVVREFMVACMMENTLPYEGFWHDFVSGKVKLWQDDDKDGEPFDPVDRF